jgi:hypothetical protein
VDFCPEVLPTFILDVTVTSKMTGDVVVTSHFFSGCATMGGVKDVTNSPRAGSAAGMKVPAPNREGGIRESGAAASAQFNFRRRRHQGFNTIHGKGNRRPLTPGGNPAGTISIRHPVNRRSPVNHQPTMNTNKNLKPLTAGKLKKAGALAILLSVVQLFSFSASCQTNTTSTNSTTDILGFLGISSSVVSSLESSGILEATNWAVSPYLTYAPSAKDKVGGGVLAGYDFPALTGTNGSVGMALGADWLGHWSLVSGNITLQAETHPFNIGLFSFLPGTLRTNLAAEPIVIAGIGAPMSGSVGAAELWDVGYNVKVGPYLQSLGAPSWVKGLGAGATWGEWMNAGNESGHRYHFFIDYRWKF